MPQLAECAAGDHASNPRKTSVGADATRSGGSAKPQAPTIALDPCSERTIIDDLMPNGLNAAGFCQRRGTYKNAPPGRSGFRAARIGDPGRRIKLEEKINECWNQEFLRH